MGTLVDVDLLSGLGCGNTPLPQRLPSRGFPGSRSSIGGRRAKTFFGGGRVWPETLRTVGEARRLSAGPDQSRAPRDVAPTQCYAPGAAEGRAVTAEELSLTYVIAEPCIDVLDLSCVAVCPVDCIHFEEGVDRKLFIDPDECIDCGACEPECPVNAIFPEETLPAEWVKFTAMDATWYTDKAAARAAVDEAKPR